MLCKHIAVGNTVRSDSNRREKNRESSLRRLFLVYKKRAKSRGTDFTIDELNFYHLISSNCNYCGKKPSNLFKEKCYRTGKKYYPFCYNGIDRVDNKLGYVDGNCVASCTECNRMKSDFSLKKFKNHIKRVFTFTWRPNVNIRKTSKD